MSVQKPAGERMRALMRVVVSWLAVAGALVLAMATGGAAMRFMPSLDLDNPALAQIPPVPGAPSHRLARRVVVVIVDGLRYDASRSMSFLATVRARGIDSQATSHYPSMSRPNYVSIATGVPPRWSGVRTNDYAAPVRLDSMMARARAAGMRVTYISQVATGPSRMFLTHIDVPVVAPFEGEMELKARDALARDDELVVLLFSDVDGAGHARGADSDEYVAAVKKVDGMLARLLGDFDYEHDALVIVADHGHVDSGGHGGIEPEVMAVPLVLAGRGIRSGAPLVSPTLIDLAPTVSALLGLPAPGHSLGVTWASALELEARERDAIQRADSQRIRVLYSVMDEVRAEAETRAWSTRITRGALVLFGVAALVIVITWIARRGITLIDPRVLLVGVPAFPLTFYGMVLVFEQFLSPSMIPAEAPLTNKLFLYGAVAAAVNLAMSWLVVTRRTCPGDRIAAATGLCLVSLLIALVPAGIAWTVAGPPFTVNLPQPNVLMLPPVTFAAVACFGVSAAVLVVAQYVVYMVRGSGADTAAESSRRPDSPGKHP